MRSAAGLVFFRAARAAANKSLQQTGAALRSIEVLCLSAAPAAELCR